MKKHTLLSGIIEFIRLGQFHYAREDAESAPGSLTVPTDVPTLAEAYEAIAPGGAITVLRGKYKIPRTITITKDVKITGDVKNPKYVVLQGGEESVFHLQSGFAEIAGMTIQNEEKKARFLPPTMRFSFPRLSERFTIAFSPRHTEAALSPTPKTLTQT